MLSVHLLRGLPNFSCHTAAQWGRLTPALCGQNWQWCTSLLCYAAYAQCVKSLTPNTIRSEALNGSKSWNINFSHSINTWKHSCLCTACVFSKYNNRKIGKLKRFVSQPWCCFSKEKTGEWNHFFGLIFSLSCTLCFVVLGVSICQWTCHTTQAEQAKCLAPLIFLLCPGSCWDLQGCACVFLLCLRAFKCVFTLNQTCLICRLSKQSWQSYRTGLYFSISCFITFLCFGRWLSMRLRIHVVLRVKKCAHIYLKNFFFRWLQLSSSSEQRVASFCHYDGKQGLFLAE